jgi:pyruvate/2-oxoglutarate dehydrogenase complex dihydrolipoamide acyltransferase (E2) component
MQGIDFPTTAIGFAVGSGGRILHTTDAGTTWVDQTSGTSANLNGVSFAGDALTGVAVGDGGIILRTTNGGEPTPTPTPSPTATPTPTPTATTTPTPTPTPTPGAITLSANGRRVQGRHTVDLSWTGATSVNIDIYRDGVLIATVSNNGAYKDSIGVRGGNVRYIYKVCDAGTQNCSNQVTVRFGGPPL